MREISEFTCGVDFDQAIREENTALKKKLAEAEELLKEILIIKEKCGDDYFTSYCLGLNIRNQLPKIQDFLSHQPGEYVAVRREDLEILLSDPGYMPGPIEAEAYDNLKSALEVKETKWKRYNI